MNIAVEALLKLVVDVEVEFAEVIDKIDDLCFSGTNPPHDSEDRDARVSEIRKRLPKVTAKRDEVWAAIEQALGVTEFNERYKEAMAERLGKMPASAKEQIVFHVMLPNPGL